MNVYPPTRLNVESYNGDGESITIYKDRNKDSWIDSTRVEYEKRYGENVSPANPPSL